MGSSAKLPSAEDIPHSVEEEDDPATSSASMCIEFSMLGQTFRPVYTHQVFPGEWIRGYRPFQDRISVIPTENVHSSFQNHEKSNTELLVTISLAPSCEYSSLHLATRRKQSTPPLTRKSKRARLETVLPDAGSEADESFGDVGEENAGEEDDEEYEDHSEASNERETSADAKEGSTRLMRMPLSEVKLCIEKYVPSVKDNLSSELEIQSSYLQNLIGETIEEYQRDGNDFVLTLASGKESLDFHSRVQRLATWYIETADEVNIADDSDGYWKVLYLFRRHKRLQYSFSGYMTLYHFRSPFHKPTPGIILRIAQVLLLPPYQRMGHGRKMMHAVFDRILELGTTPDDKAIGLSSIVQVNVEDPAPQCSQLRNRVDFERFLSSKKNGEDWFGAASGKTPDDPSFFVHLSEAEIVQVSARAKVTKQQVQIVYELYRLQQLESYELLPVNQQHKDALDKKYRLMVKSRLNKMNAEDLSACRTKEEKQRLLNNMFVEVLAKYQAILSSLARTLECN